MRRLLRPLALAGALLLAQWLCLGHGFAHLDDAGPADDRSCSQCLALAGTAAAPPPGGLSAELPPAPVAAPATRLRVGAAWRPAIYFLSRAPPVSPG
jgi:hypothetical protein